MALLGAMQGGSEGPLQRPQGKAWKRFEEAGLPSRRDEAFRYVPLSRLYSTTFSDATPADVGAETVRAHVYPECRESVLVFVNGVFSEALSDISGLPQQLVVAPLSRAYKTYGAFLNNRWTRALKEEQDPFALLNASMHGEGAFVYLPPKLCVEHPIQILHLISAENQVLSTRLHVVASAESEATFVTKNVVLAGDNFLVNQYMDFAVEENARIKLAGISQGTETSWHFEAVRATLKRDSSLETVSFTNGTQTVRQSYSAALMGEGADVQLNGVWMLDQNRQAHIHVLVDHQAPHCTSRQVFKGVLDGVSRSSFEGKILVRQAAQQTDAYQMNNNLLLSDHAIANGKPNLEIFADDVKASHGVTVGQLREEDLFYFKTRGVPENVARRLLVAGFAKEICELVTLPSLRQEMLSLVDGASHTGL